jgi:hypothetical protein
MERRVALAVITVALVWLSFFRLQPAHLVSAADAKVPVIVELFTSEGCSDCPPADLLLRKLEAQQPVANADIIVLSEHVDYWNSRKWKDRFSSSELTDRQKRYVEAFKLDSAYTPQMVVQGEAQMNGANAGKALKAIAQAAQNERTEVSLQFKSDQGQQFAVYGVDDSASPRDAELVLAVTESGLQSEVKGGENGGHTLQHTGVVRSWKTFPVKKMSVGGIMPLKIDPSWNRANLRVVAFVQDKKTMHILGATSEKFPQ